MTDAMGAVVGTVAISILVGIGVGTTAFLIGKNVGESEAYDFMFKRFGGGIYRFGRDRSIEQVKETPDERLKTALTELMVAMQQAHCTNHDKFYCDNECPAKAGNDECVWCKCYGVCEELGIEERTWY